MEEHYVWLMLRLMRLRMILGIILSCFRRGVSPWRFFQLNAPHFNDSKGVFSKLDIEQMIPDKWRLPSVSLDHEASVQEWADHIGAELSFPVFIKPEWGQNSHGVYRVLRAEDLHEVLQEVKSHDLPYFAQQGADYEREIDLFFVGSPHRDADARCFSVTEMLDIHGERLPIHSVHNGTKYRDLTDELSSADRSQLWKLLGELGDYRMARVGVKTPSLEALVEGVFQIVEINLFTPMPINMLDPDLSRQQQAIFLEAFSRAVAESVAELGSQPNKPIFWRKTQRHFALKRKASFDKLHTSA